MFLRKLPILAMNFIKKRFGSWFENNFTFYREDKYQWVIKPESSQGFLWIILIFILLFLLFILPFILVPIGWTIFLIHNIYPIIIARLGVASWLKLPLLVISIIGCNINLPFLVWKLRYSQSKVKFEILPLWLLKCGCLSFYKDRYYNYGFIAINLTGGLIPIVLALFQLRGTQPVSIAIVTAIVTLISYFLVTVIPAAGIVTKFSRFCLITTVAAFCAMSLVQGGETNHIDASVAFAGAVLGTTIGADLLHLRDVLPQYSQTLLSVGGAGFNDGILLCGLCSLMIVEWVPKITAWLSSYF